MISGVCGGLAEYFEVDPVLMRLLVVVGTVLSGGLGLFIYIVLWIIMPKEGEEIAPRSARWRQSAEEIAFEARRIGSDVREAVSPSGAGARETVAAGGTVTTEERGEVQSTSTAEGEQTTETTERTTVITPAEGLADDLESLPDERRTQQRRQTWAGIVLVGLGLWLLADNLRLLSWIRADVLLPLALLGVGGWLLYNQVRDRSR
jgi:phage shock protein C